MGLHESYAVARGQILMVDPLPSVTQAFFLIKQDEKQKQGFQLPTSFSASVKTSHLKSDFGSSESVSTDGSQIPK